MMKYYIAIQKYISYLIVYKAIFMKCFVICLHHLSIYVTWIIFMYTGIHTYTFYKFSSLERKHQIIHKIIFLGNVNYLYVYFFVLCLIPDFLRAYMLVL